jgi:hypothetical protein
MPKHNLYIFRNPFLQNLISLSKDNSDSQILEAAADFGYLFVGGGINKGNPGARHFKVPCTCLTTN